MPNPSGDAAAADLKPARLAVAFDFGRRRIGVACGDTLSRTARALPGIANGPGGPRWNSLDALLREWQPAQLVVGLPYNTDDSAGTLSHAVQGFAAELMRRYGLPVGLVDERYSSLEAQSRLRSQRQTGQRRRRVTKTDVDAAAACIILERWFVEST